MTSTEVLFIVRRQWLELKYFNLKPDWMRKCCKHSENWEEIWASLCNRHRGWHSTSSTAISVERNEWLHIRSYLQCKNRQHKCENGHHRHRKPNRLQSSNHWIADRRCQRIEIRHKALMFELSQCKTGITTSVQTLHLPNSVSTWFTTLSTKLCTTSITWFAMPGMSSSWLIVVVVVLIRSVMFWTGENRQGVKQQMTCLK